MRKITGRWLDRPATQTICDALQRDGATVLFVGGCVRNSLLSVPVGDIDIATDAKPETVMSLARAAGIKAVPTGIEHGTVTLVREGIAHEVTTFRRDVDTDGRHAVVAFSKKVEEDAARRDFTMNALYARPDGTVIDPIGGMPDLIAGRVRFIGSADERIREDYLRSLRYFRFHAWYGNQSAGMDSESLSSIGANLDGIDKVSRERVGHEMIKLLAAPDPTLAIAGMQATGLLAHVLPGASPRALQPLVHLEAELGIQTDPLRRLAALGGTDLGDALRLSRTQIAQVESLRDFAASATGAGELGYRLNSDMARDVLLLRCALLEKPWNHGALREVDKGASAEFPVSGRDLMPGLKDKALGARLAELETKWIESGFSLTREELLS